ncbi:hypothetical protein SDJN03_06798, partial [Cucurbita argyrosperma subsp. sororia]
MRTEKAVIAGLGLGGLLASGLLGTPEAMAAEASNDARGQLLLIVVAPAILWVLYNILQPALNQLNRMRSLGKGKKKSSEGGRASVRGFQSPLHRGSGRPGGAGIEEDRCLGFHRNGLGALPAARG